LFAVTVPGVNKILGTFSSCSKGPAVCTLGSSELVVSFEKRNDSYVKVCLTKTGECKKFQLSSIRIKKEDKWCNVVKGVYIIMSQRYQNLPCYDIDLDGSLLECEGHVMYSAVALATVKALDKTMGLKLSQDDFVKLANDALVSISEAGNLVNLIAMTHLKKGQFVIFDGAKQTFKIFENPFASTPYSLVIADGHIPVGPLKEEVTTKEKEILSANQAFMDMYVGCSILQLNGPDLRDKISSFDEDVKRYCTYLFEEARSVMNVEAIFEKKDIAALGNIFSKVKTTSDDNLEVICPEIDWIIKRSNETSGCIGACAFYEGYKTKAAILCKNENIAQLTRNVEDYQHIFGFNITSEVIGDYPSR